MRVSHYLRLALLTLSLPLFAAAACAQAQKPYEPHVGQQGKDVIWVPTPQVLVDKMLDMAQLTPADYVIDLGSGNGVTVSAAAKRGARALGIEYNPDMVELSKRSADKEGVADKASFVKADIFESDFSRATVITMYLLPALNLRLRPTILDLKPGTRIVSHAFTMEDWKADQTESVDGRTAYLWIVPAKVEGTWQLAQGELLLTQTFQMLMGTLKTGNGTATIANGRLRGDQISFTAGNAEYTGRVTGNKIEGAIKGAGAWSATRAGSPATPAR